ncbi:MAG: hypothetical protein LBV74_09355 [Tannerella sp.]|jgi:hypothetical protein|nr:hypothetical protein [Tannerella sp.]
MKKNSSYFIVMLLSAISLTSCLDGGGNVSSYAGLGVIDIGSKSFVTVLKTTGGEIYTPEISSMVSKGDLRIGDCLCLYYKVDFDLAENSNSVVATNGYYTASLNGYQKFDKNYLNYSFTDTTGLQMNEVAVSNPFYTDYGGINGFYSRYMYITHVVSQPEDLTLSWDLSYDSETMMPTEVDGKRYYDLFVRATKTNESSKTTNVTFPYYIAYDMRDYLSTAAALEKEALGGSYNTMSTFTIRINYASAINGDVITWSSKEWSPYISLFLSDGK